MKYHKIIRGQFEARPNRFIAHVWIDNKDVVEGTEIIEAPVSERKQGMTLVVVHVKNTGRCKELLTPLATVILEVAENPTRKTKYDLIAVYKKDFGLINMDSQAPNKVAYEWLQSQGYSVIKPEFTYGQSRVDFYMEQMGESGKITKYLMEVKGCTLEIDGVGYFPDAPTTRGVKHLKELTAATKQGYQCMVAFVIQMEHIWEVRANVEMHPEFGTALEDAKGAGVKVIALCCKVFEDELYVDEALILS
ncbi:MAG: DNA/RNA nuclease SfsA [Lachnospiraceae bacterium]